MWWAYVGIGLVWGFAGWRLAVIWWGGARDEMWQRRLDAAHEREAEARRRLAEYKKLYRHVVERR